ncbi:MAG: hypothetical protein GXP44_00590 [bacterium]|nr:hypothetical protein [bacterium]
MNERELVNKLVQIYEQCLKNGKRAMDMGIGYDFKKKIISLDTEDVTHIILLKDLVDIVGDTKGRAIWGWVRSGPNCG